MPNLLIRGRLVLLDDGSIGPASVVVRDGKIHSVVKGVHFEDKNFDEIIDGGDLVIMPGLVDSHVHVNEPGRTPWEGFGSATKAAAKGGFTTIVDMPLNSIPPTTTVKNLKTKLRSALGQCFVDVAFWGGVVPDNVADLREMVNYGVAGFKCFLIHSGVDEFPCVDEMQVRQALSKLEGSGSVLLFHAEKDVPINEDLSGDAELYETFLKSRPSEMENDAIQMVIRLCEESGVRCHIVHLGSGEAIESLREAQQRNVPISVETCHHYLNLLAEEVPRGATQFKCCPPVRTRHHQEALWEGVRDGVIELVVSDHSPCTPDLKLLDSGDFLKAWGGISSLQFGLSLFWTAAKRRGFDLQSVNTFLARGPAKLASLGHRKGLIREGYDADFVIWDPHASLDIKIGDIEHKNKVTPYLGKTLHGVVKQTILRGKVIYNNGKLVENPHGELLLGGKLYAEIPN